MSSILSETEYKDQTRTELIAVKNVKADIKKIKAKRQEQLEKIKSKPFSITIDGEEYHTYYEIVDAYGVGIITERQRDNALMKLERHDADDDSEVLKEEINYWDSLLELVEKKEKELSDEELHF